MALCYHTEMLSFLLLSLLSSVVFAGFSAESLRARIEDGRYIVQCICTCTCNKKCCVSLKAAMLCFRLLCIIGARIEMHV